MGWLMMFSVMFFVAAIGSINYSMERRDRELYDKAASVSTAMGVWHQSAVQFCNVPNNCPDAMLVIPSSIKLGTGFGKFSTNVLMNSIPFERGDFVSLYEPDAHVVVTFYRAKSGDRQYDGQVVAAFTAVQGWNLASGFYDAANQRVDRGRAIKEDNPLFDKAKVPNNIGGVAVPDNAPIIVSQVH